MKVLVTGFDPFGGEKVNPAWEVARALPARVGGAEVVRVQVPTSYRRGPAAVAEAVRAEAPDLVLCLGQAGGRTAVTPEFVGINWRRAAAPDNDGDQPAGERILPEGPDAYFSTLPVQAMADAMCAAGVPASVSYTAGTFVCNDVLYELLHLLAAEFPGARGGFTHVPFLPEQAAQKGGRVASVPLELAVRGVTVALEAALG